MENFLIFFLPSPHSRGLGFYKFKENRKNFEEVFGFFTFCFVIYKIFKRSNSRYNDYNRQPCLIVGLPCGQFQGASNVDKLAKIFFMRCFVSGVPIMMDERQALMASMFRTLLGRTTVLLVEFNPTES